MELKTKKKIIFLLPIFGGEGGERVVSELSLNLPANIEKIIVAFENKNYYPYQGKLISLNIKLSQSFFVKPFIFLKGLLRFRKIVINENPDWTISLGNLQNVINILVGRNSIVRVDGYISESSRRLSDKIYFLLVKMLFNRAKKIIVVSRSIKKDLISRFGVRKEKIQVIHNPIDIDKIHNLAKEELEPCHKSIFQYPVIINLGTLLNQKGQWHLIRAFKEAKKRRKDLKLVILGEGDLKNYLKKLAENLGLKNEVYFLGWQKNPFKFLAKAKLFVFSSLWEGLGIAILEALACGIPVVSADCKAGPREILSPKTPIGYQTKDIEYSEYGILIPPFDRNFYGAAEPITKEEKILSKAMLEAVENKELWKKLSKKGKERANDFDVKKIIKEYNFLN